MGIARVLLLCHHSWRSLHRRPDFANKIRSLHSRGDLLTVVAVRGWHVFDGTVGTNTAALLLGQAFGTLDFGLLADRRGRKVCLEQGIIAAMVAYALMRLAPAPG